MIKIHYGDVGYGYGDVFKAYLKGAKKVTIQDPYIRQNHQISNFLRFADYNGSTNGGNYHVIFVDMAASW